MEVLIGLTLLSVVLVLLFGGLRIGARSWDVGEQRAKEGSDMLIVQNFLRNRLAAAQPLTDDFSGDEPVFSFQGTAARLEFVSVLPSYGGRGGLRKFILEWPAKGDTGPLTVSLTPFYPTLENAEHKVEDIVLLENVEKFQVSYYGVETPGDEPEWTNEWTEKETLPQMISLEIRIEGQAPWPPLVVAPRITASPGV